MGNVPIHRRLIRQLTRNSSGTISVSIPIEHVSVLGWEKGRQVVINRHGNKLVIEAAGKRPAKRGKNKQ